MEAEVETRMFRSEGPAALGQEADPGWTHYLHMDASHERELDALECFLLPRARQDGQLHAQPPSSTRCNVMYCCRSSWTSSVHLDTWLAKSNIIQIRNNTLFYVTPNRRVVRSV